MWKPRVPLLLRRILWTSKKVYKKKAARDKCVNRFFAEMRTKLWKTCTTKKLSQAHRQKEEEPPPPVPLCPTSFAHCRCLIRFAAIFLVCCTTLVVVDNIYAAPAPTAQLILPPSPFSSLLLPLRLPQPLGRSCARVCFSIFATFHSFCFVISTRKQQTWEGNGKRNKLRTYSH